MTEAERKRVGEKVGFWDKLKVAVTPGDVSERSKKLRDIADSNEREEAMQEAIRRKRMNAGE